MSCSYCNSTGDIGPYEVCPWCDGTGGKTIAQALPCVVQHGSGSSWCNTCGGKWDFGDDFPCPEAVQPVDVNLSFGRFDALVFSAALLIGFFVNAWVGAGCMAAWALWFALRDGIPDAPPGE